MANFDIAVTKTILNEGGDKYTDYAFDKGGATKYGISLSFYKTLPGKSSATYQDIKNLSLDDAKSIYKKYFWDANKYGDIASQDDANKIFDMSVLIGAGSINRILQKSLGMDNKDIDGIIGASTLGKINSKNIGCELTLGLVKHFVSICNKNKAQSVNLLGWINRALS